ncbi:MAG: DinB family protein [Bacteroidota bacterium]|jgi:uncharacterized damage-inducible protein DinB
MKFILAILLFSVPFEGIAQTNQMLIESHVIKFKNSKTYTLSIAEKLDTDKFDFNPVKEGMSFKEQLVHIGENIYWLSSIYINEEINPINTNKTRASEMNKEQVLQFLASAYDYAIKAMSEVDEKTLSKEFNWSGGKMNKFQFLNLIQDHQSHHVGQLIVYLRLNNITPPKYIGW